MKVTRLVRSISAVAGVALGAIAILAANANEVAERLAQAGSPAGGPTAFGSAGNPTPLGNLQPSYRVSDLTFDTGLGPFTFQRFYSNSNDTWSYKTQAGDWIGLLGEPFGRSPKKSRDGGAGSMLWWHNLYAFVKYVKPECTSGGCTVDAHYVVRDVGGTLLHFNPWDWGCNALEEGCLIQQAQGAQGVRLLKTASGYTLFHPDGRRHHFETPTGTSLGDRFLTRIDAPEFPATEGGQDRQILELRYAPPPGCSGVFDGNTSSGVPYLSEVANFTATGWRGSKLEFEYDLIASSASPAQPTECVLTRVSVVPSNPDDAGERSVTYAYLAGDAGLLAYAHSLPTRGIETYDYGNSVSPRWRVDRRQDGGQSVLVALKTLADAGNGVEGFGEYILADEDPISRWLVTAQNPDSGTTPACPPGRIGDPCPDAQVQIFSSSPLNSDQYRYLGDGTRTTAQVQRRFDVAGAGLGGQTTKSTRQCLSGCPSPVGTQPQSESWGLTSGWLGDDVAPDWMLDRAGSYTDYVYGNRDGGGYDTELRAIYSGATSAVGANALAEKHFEYLYKDEALGSQRLLKKSWSPTVVSGATGSAGVENTYDSRNRLTASIAFGKSVAIDGTVFDRYIGTFYTYGADPFGRVTAIEGPCLTTSTSATACSETPAPKKAFEYYTSTLSSTNAGKLRYEHVYPSGASGSPLTVEYVTYDSQGRLLVEKDVNGILTCRAYENDFLASVRVGADSDCDGGEVTEYSYDANGRLRWVHSPSGQYELYCYRKNSDAACSSGDLTSRVQWKGRGSTSSFSAVQEKVEFEYSSGSLLQETTKDSTGAIRSIKRYEADPFGRSTFEGWGDSTRAGNYSTTRGFNVRDQVNKVGFAYNAPDSFCATSGQCAGLSHDRLGRLLSLTQFPSTGSANQPTCFLYGNAPAPQLTYTGTNGTCVGNAPGTSTSYMFDDFGNMVATGPMTDASNLSRFEYDARGNLIKKKTPAMRAATVEYTYDMLGRLLAASTGAQALYSFDYDDNGGTAPSGCGTLYTLGRVRRQLDSFGATWLSYDNLGRVVEEKRSRTSQGACTGGSLNDNPNGATSYLPGGRVGSITYPHGRVVTYGYSASLPDRMVSISSNAPSSPSVTMISDIQWEPYGGLRSYLAGTTPATRVEYLKGGDGHSTPGSPCSMSRPIDSSNDRTGRLRALWVSTNAGTSGDAYRRGYTWRADQLVQEDTCLLDELGQTVRYSAADGGNGYDRTLALQAVSRPQLEHQGPSGTGGTLGRRDYTYDGRGNRLTDVHDCWNFNSTYLDGGMLASRTATTSWCNKAATAYGVGFTYDVEGRALTRSSPVGGGYTGTKNVIAFDWSLGAGTTAATGSVFRTATVNGLVYEYFYDASGRRRLKDHPVGEDDEYFYLGGSLIEDRGVNDDFAATALNYPLDEYIWLAGVPVAMVRTQVSTTWQRTGSNDCTRNGESAACGVYFPVIDYIGKPILMLDSEGKVAGVGDYDPFGHVNRVTALGETPHPHAAQTNVALTHLIQPPLSKTQVLVRPRLALLDTESPAAGYVYVSDKADLLPDGGWGCLTNPDGGIPQSCDGWTTLPPDGVGKIRFKSTSNAGSAYQGAVLEGYEFWRSQKTASRAWTPIRLPGQYYDAETDLFENWNRFYDPSIGRYLSPDPILLSPGAVVSAAAGGMISPAYAYASNNPIAFIDPTGLETGIFVDGLPSGGPWGFFSRIGDSVAAGGIALDLYLAMKSPGKGWGDLFKGKEGGSAESGVKDGEIVSKEAEADLRAVASQPFRSEREAVAAVAQVLRRHGLHLGAELAGYVYQYNGSIYVTMPQRGSASNGQRLLDSVPHLSNAHGALTATGATILGTYHSHPFTSTPSSGDMTTRTASPRGFVIAPSGVVVEYRPRSWIPELTF